MPAMTRIMDTIATLQGGDRVGARQAFAEIWKGLVPDGDLAWTFDMAAMSEPLQNHLAAKLTRVD